MNGQVIIAIVLAAIIGVAVGTVVNLRSVRTGAGPSTVGLAVQAITLAVFIVTMATLASIAALSAGPLVAALPLLLSVPVVLFLVVGTIQRARSGRR